MGPWRAPDGRYGSDIHPPLIHAICDITVVVEKVAQNLGCQESVEWNGGMEWWNGTLEWNTGMG